MSVGIEVRRQRKALGMTGVELAEKAGLAPSAVSQIETGRRTPSSTSVFKLAEALGVGVGDLYPKAQPQLLPIEQSAVVYGPSPGEGLRPETLEWLEERGLDYTAMGSKEFDELMRPGGIPAPPSRLAELLQKVIPETEELEALRRSDELPPGGLTEALRAWERAASRWFTLSAQSQIQAQQAASQAAAS